MKKAVLLIVLALVAGSAMAQEQEAKKTHIFGVNPLLLLADVYYGHYGILTNEGRNEINLPFFFVAGAGGAYSIGPKYRWYTRGDWRGPFWGAGVDVGTVAFDWNQFDGIIASPKVELGYRWRWENGFTLAPVMVAKVPMGMARDWNSETELHTGEEKFAVGGLHWSVGLGLAWMF